MCGFAGVVAWDDRYRVSRETLGRMSASIAHRGPDGEGYHISHEGEVTPERVTTLQQRGYVLIAP